MVSDNNIYTNIYKSTGIRMDGFRQKLDVFEKNACLPPPRVPPCALLKEGKERDMTVLNGSVY